MNEFLVEKLANIIRDNAVAVQAPPRTILVRYPWYEANAEALAPIVLDQSKKARTLRAVRRLAFRYPWGRAMIENAMDQAGVDCEEAMPELDIEALLSEVERQHERAMAACDDEDAPPAR